MENSFNSFFFILSGPSGVGKTTLIRKLLSEDKNLIYSVSITSRKPREGEIDGKDYYFISKEKFKELIKSEKLLEWEIVYGEYYGTPWENIKNAIKKKKDIILDLDIKGALKVKKNLDSAITIFIKTTEVNELINRINTRGTECEKEKEQRTKCIYEELSYADKFDFIVINDNINFAVNKIKKIIQDCRAKR